MNRPKIIEAFCAEVRDGPDHATFEDKRKYFDLLSVSGKLAFENGEKVIDVQCLLGKQRLVQVQTLPSASNHNVPPVLITQRIVLASRIPSHLHELTFAYADNIIADIQAQ